ncbi:MAG: hypothetical protein PHQ98_01280 [Candidatus ainarchaeum sp.]|nr:hypothetical protein [Candidatus ainarchaeum sp.]
MVQKKVIIKLLNEAKDDYLKLKESVKIEKEKGISSSIHQTLLKSIESKFELLKTNYDYGIQIPKKNFPKKYIELFNITNLWKIDLPNYWRMIYTLNQQQRDQTEIEIITIYLDVLDIIDHNKYNKIFRYKKR